MSLLHVQVLGTIVEAIVTIVNIVLSILGARNFCAQIKSLCIS